MRRNNFPDEQIPQWFLLLSENLSASYYPGAAVCHLHAEAFFEVHFPLGGIRVRCPFDLDMPLNGHVPCTKEREFMGLPLLTRVGPYEGPLSSMARAKVFVRHPSMRLLRVPPYGPGPQTPEDGCIHFVEDDLADHVAVRVCPPANHGMKVGNQLARRGLLVRLHHFPHVPEESLCMLAGRFDEQFPRVLAEMLSQEIEAVLKRGEVGFRWRKFQPAFAQKLHHKRFDLVCQEFRRTPCNDESSSAGESHPRALSDPD